MAYQMKVAADELGFYEWSGSTATHTPTTHRWQLEAYIWL